MGEVVNTPNISMTFPLMKKPTKRTILKGWMLTAGERLPPPPGLVDD